MKSLKKFMSFMIIIIFTMFSFTRQAFGFQESVCDNEIIEDNEHQDIEETIHSNDEYIATYKKIAGNIVIVINAK